MSADLTHPLTAQGKSTGHADERAAPRSGQVARAVGWDGRAAPKERGEAGQADGKSPPCEAGAHPPSEVQTRLERTRSGWETGTLQPLGSRL